MGKAGAAMESTVWKFSTTSVLFVEEHDALLTWKDGTNFSSSDSLLLAYDLPVEKLLFLVIWTEELLLGELFRQSAERLWLLPRPIRRLVDDTVFSPVSEHISWASCLQTRSDVLAERQYGLSLWLSANSLYSLWAADCVDSTSLSNLFIFWVSIMSRSSSQADSQSSVFRFLSGGGGPNADETLDASLARPRHSFDIFLLVCSS